MSSPKTSPPWTLKACHCCGLIHRLSRDKSEQRHQCTRCFSTIQSPKDSPSSSSRTAAAALGALILFWPATLLPIIEMERLGQRSESSIFSGTLELFSKGDLIVGTAILLFSIVLPLVKITLLLELSLMELLQRKHRALTYRITEFLGKWSMMDVMLIAFLVMLVKLGNLVTFSIGPAAWAFVMCVCMSMVASLSFDPHAIWKEEHE